MCCCQYQTNPCGCSGYSSCSGCSGCGQCSGSVQTGQTSYLVYRYRYENVPMQTYYGQGYTNENVLESMDRSLQRIAVRF